MILLPTQNIHVSTISTCPHPYIINTSDRKCIKSSITVEPASLHHMAITQQIEKTISEVFQTKSVLISSIKDTMFMFNTSACSASMQESSSEVGTPTWHGSIYTILIPAFSTHTNIVLHNSMFLFKLIYNHIETQNIKWCLAFQRFLCNHETYSISKQKIII
jgi:hypothetical protein